jgi:hypothetical protein
MLKRIVQFVSEMCRTWGALVTGGFLVGLIGVWLLTGHILPPKIGWVVCIGGIIVATFQMWNRQVDATQKGQQDLDQANRYHASEISALNHAFDEAEHNHKTAMAALHQEMENSRAMNNPFLVFNVANEMRMGTLCDIYVDIENAGEFPTNIVDGDLRVQSFTHPDVNNSLPLNGVQLVGKGKRRMTLTVKRVYLSSEQDATVPPARLIINAIYTQPNGTRHQVAKYVYVPNQRRFDAIV